jgi:membrane protease YdiL (CAAX protease family)
MAFFMILAYEKTGSIFGAMGVHFLNNLVATVMILITM